MKKAVPAILAVLLAAACSKEEAKQNTANAVNKVTTKVQDVVDDISTPFGKPDNAAEREKQRFDAQWRQLESFRTQPAQAAPPSNFAFVSNRKESFKGLDANAINNAPVNVPITGDVKGPSVLRAQVYLDRLHFSVGSIDGRWGRNSAITVWWFQRTRGLEPTGDVDEQTFRRIAAEAGYPPVVVRHTLTADDLKGPFRAIPESVYEQEKLDYLGYETDRETFGDVPLHAGFPPAAQSRCEVLRSAGRADDLCSQCPAAADRGSARHHPNRDLDLRQFARWFRCQPEPALPRTDDCRSRIRPFTERVAAHREDRSRPALSLRPDALSRGPRHRARRPPPARPEHAGGHRLDCAEQGALRDSPHARPDSIGYASSHGCVRLTNWDAEELEHRAGEGVQVSFVDTRK